MGLSSDLVSQFSKIVNTKNESSINTLRGTIVKYDESLYVQLDGSNEITPVARTVELNEGDRVEVSIQNHSATVTGNLTSPSIGVVTEGNLRSEIEQRANYIKLKVENEDGTFTEYKQTIDAFYFMDPEGTMKIKGGSLYLTGCIKFEDLTDGMQDRVETIETDISDNAKAAANAKAIATKIANGEYSGGTFIDGTEIYSPTIIGGELYAVDEDSLVQITSESFAMYLHDTMNPKAMISYVNDKDDDSKDMVTLILGSGQTNDADTGNRFYINKHSRWTDMYYLDEHGDKAGFKFGESGAIEVYGYIEGLSDGIAVTPVWG